MTLPTGFNFSRHITKKDITKERRSYMAICESGYYNKVTRICGERHLVKRLYHSFEDSRNLLLEAANVVLLRYFGLRRYRGNIKTETVLMDGKICESIYVSTQTFFELCFFSLYINESQWSEQTNRLTFLLRAQQNRHVRSRLLRKYKTLFGKTHSTSLY